MYINMSIIMNIFKGKQMSQETGISALEEQEFEITDLFIETRSGHSIMCPKGLGPYTVNVHEHLEGSGFEGEYLEIGMENPSELYYLYDITIADISHIEYNGLGRNRKDEFIQFVKEGRQEP